jgi:hypothetical protein
MVAAVYEELADNLRGTAALLVEIDLAVLHAEDAELGLTITDAYLRQDLVHQIGMQRVVRGEVA